MARLPIVSWIGNAAAVMTGKRGSVSEQAQAAGCSRQTAYDHAEKVEAAVRDAVGGGPSRDQLQEQVRQQAERLALLEKRLAKATEFSEQAHCIWSESQQAYVPAGSLRVGELFHTRSGGTARLEAISRPRYGLVKLYNFEVEEFHNYFVGKAGIQVHNGLPGSCGVPLPEDVTEAEAEMIAAERLSVVTPREAGIVAPPDHHLFPQGEVEFFEQRGVNIDDYTVTLDQATHEALHYGGGPGNGGGWWNETIMENIQVRELAAGRMLTPQEIMEEGQLMLQLSKLDGLSIHPYNSIK